MEIEVDTVVVDAEALELGATQVLPKIRKPRWTPNVGAVGVDRARRAITPDAVRCDVAGEIVLRRP